MQVELNRHCEIHVNFSLQLLLKLLLIIRLYIVLNPTCSGKVSYTLSLSFSCHLPGFHYFSLSIWHGLVRGELWKEAEGKLLFIHLLP